MAHRTRSPIHLAPWCVAAAVGCAPPSTKEAETQDSGRVAPRDSGCLERTWYEDVDSDGHGDPLKPVAACVEPPGVSAVADDCNDLDGTVSPSATEVCNGVDDDCDGEADEGLLRAYTEDLDRDGYGDPSTAVEACDSPPGVWVDDAPGAADDDCDDSDDSVHPGATEVCGDGVDNDCDGVAGACALSGALTTGDADVAFLNPGAIRVTGASLAMADFDGDGVDDLVLGTTRFTPAGSASKYFGAVRLAAGGPDWAGEVVDPDDLPGWLGETHSSLMGITQAVADVDGDGTPDLLSGAILSDRGADSGGAVYLFLGADPGGIEQSAAAADIAFVGATVGQRLLNPGWPGDLDGDGRTDLLVGDVLDFGTSRAWLLYNDDAWTAEVDVADSADFVIEAASSAEKFTYGDGTRMGAAGDLDGDGVAELFFCNPYADTNTGEVSILRSDAGVRRSGIATTEDADLRVSGSHAEGTFGAALYPVGDRDHDGVDDVIIADFDGEPVPDGTSGGSYGPGRLVWVSGAAWTEAEWAAADDLSGWTLDGEPDTEHRLGRSVVLADFNGDGHDDLATSTQAGGGDAQGSVGVVHGPLSWEGSLSWATDLDATLVGTDSGGQFGSKLAAGDLNGDGVDDLAVAGSLHGYIGPEIDYTEGGVWVFFGSSW